MKKDAFWFSHDSNAKDDIKSMKLIDQLGLEGYGIYWVLIETLRDQADYKYPIELLPILARRYNTSGEKMKAVVGTYGLFDVDEENNFFSISLNSRMLYFNNYREQRRLAGVKSAEVRASKNEMISTVVQRSFNGRSTGVQLNNKDNKDNKENINNKRNREKKVKNFIAPPLSDVKLFFKEHGYSEASAEKAFNHYDLANWHDTNGNQVKNWKQKMNTVWFKTENQEKPSVELVPPPIPAAHAKK